VNGCITKVEVVKVLQTIKSKLGLALLIMILFSAVAQATLVRQSDLRIGISTAELEGLMGQPSRVDPTPFEYEWWIYNQDYNNYFQVGVRDNEVVRIYSNSANWGYKEAQIGKRVSEVENALDLSDSIEFEYHNATITLEPQGNATDWIYMSIDREEAVDTVVQVIVDLHDDNRITAVLLSDIEANLATGNYAHRISWSGDRPEFGPRDLSTREQRGVDQALEAQFLDLINSIRVRNGIHPLTSYQPIAQVALEHSKDMYYNDFFSHNSPHTGSVGDRVEAANISFQRVLENISYGRNDAIKTHESLMNSLGHRKNILNEGIIELGAGVYQNHKYTQKFLLRDNRQLEERIEEFKNYDNYLESSIEGLSRVEVEKALFSMDLHHIVNDPKTCSIDSSLMNSLGLEVGQKVSIGTGNNSAIYTIAQAIDEGSNIVRMGLTGRKRVNQDEPFIAYLSKVEEVRVEKALFSMDLHDIANNSNHATIDVNLMNRLGLELGDEIIVRAQDSIEEFTSYTIAKVLDEGEDIIRMGLNGRQRLNQSDPFAGYISRMKR